MIWPSAPSAVSCSTLVELVRARSLVRPERSAYSFLPDNGDEPAHLTYAELDRRARAVGALLQTLNAPGERALLLYPAGLDFIAAFLGCLYAGVIAVPASPPRFARAVHRLQAIAADAQASLALTTTSVLANTERYSAEAPGLKPLRWLTTDDLADGLAEEWEERPGGSHTLAFLQYTSGSTATPKGVMVSHGNLLHNQELIKRSFRQTECSVVVGWLPLHHDMGLIGNVLQPLYLGAPCVLMSPMAFLLRPFRWLQTISRYRATTSGGPNFAYDLCVRKVTAEQRAQLDLSSWTTAFNGAEPIRHQTLERFAATFAASGFRRESFAPCYGLAEATLMVSAGSRAASPPARSFDATALEHNRVRAASPADGHARTLVSCGHIPPGQKVLIVEPEALRQCSCEEVGEIWVAGPSVAEGYWQRAAETAQTFHAYLADTGEGPFLRTGDLGFISDGELFVTGRLKDLIVIHGRNHYPQDIELTVERSHTALRPGGGAAFTVSDDGEERLVVVQEAEPRQPFIFDEVLGAVRQAVAEEHEVHLWGVVIIKAGSLPRTSSGKLQRRDCRNKFLAGELEIVDEWPRSRPPVTDMAVNV